MNEAAVRVAVIDDDASVRRSVGNLLGSVGFDVSDYASAEDFLERGSSGIDCLVLDLKLPGMSGFDLLERLRKTRTPLRVVLITAHGGEETRRRALALGAAAFLSKPFRTEDLVAAVRSCGEHGP
jgi:FixJ family two-component response regulator